MAHLTSQKKKSLHCDIETENLYITKICVINHVEWLETDDRRNRIVKDMRNEKLFLNTLSHAFRLLNETVFFRFVFFLLFGIDIDIFTLDTIECVTNIFFEVFNWLFNFFMYLKSYLSKGNEPTLRRRRPFLLFYNSLFNFSV